MTRRTKRQTLKDEKYCKHCDRVLSIDLFQFANKSTGKRRHICRDCRNQQRWFMRRVRYEYEELLIKQNNRCAICGVENEISKLAIDHNHKTLEVRGLLCHECNSGIAYFDENTEYLAKAMIYLIGGRSEKAFSIASNDSSYDFKYHGRVQRLRQKARNG